MTIEIGPVLDATLHFLGSAFLAGMFLRGVFGSK